VTRVSRRTVIEAGSNAKLETVSDAPFDDAGPADRPDRAAFESAREPPQPAAAPSVAAKTTIDALR
jgi:hypothetical protein